MLSQSCFLPVKHSYNRHSSIFLIILNVSSTYPLSLIPPYNCIYEFYFCIKRLSSDNGLA